ncbi:MAG TPA: cyclic 2,3-diphosphoglycerate synthase [Spirochaetota bacterium]|nr:cyclic 2,3-diphosphoglycerate synthase [Spirochaetota bacterium]
MQSNIRNALIMGAAGRDFHNFNVCFRKRKDIRIIAFTAAQIPDIEGRRYPPDLAGPLYPEGIPIHPESEMERLVEKFKVHDVYFSYSDVSSGYVLRKVAEVMKAQGNFILLGPGETMLKSRLPVISVCAVRTGCGKSQTTRRISDILKAEGYRTAIVRHPMPYGDLSEQRVQVFRTISDLKRYNCTIEEMEEYEPHLKKGMEVYAGVDYEEILREAEKRAQIIVWDGGNNDLPFFRPDLEIVVADPHRAGHEIEYYPGAVNFMRADVIVINKIDTSDPSNIAVVRENIWKYNPRATVVDAASPIIVEGGDAVRGKRVLVIEDGPTLTHGDMKYGAGVVAARKFGAAELVDPHAYAVGTIKDTFSRYPDMGPILPAMGYGPGQIKDLQRTIANTECDLVIIATPVDLGSIIEIKRPSVRVSYELQELGTPSLQDILKEWLKKKE